MHLERGNGSNFPLLNCLLISSAQALNYSSVNSEKEKRLSFGCIFSKLPNLLSSQDSTNNMDIKLTNKVALITGSSQGIGAATAILFSKLGAKVVITGRKDDLLAKTAQECEQASPQKEKPLVVKADLSKEDDVKMLAEKTLAKHGGIDILINNVGFGSSYGMTSPQYLESYDAMFQLNVRSIVQLTHLLIPTLKERKGSIVNVSSIAGLRPDCFFWWSYCMSKAALDMYTKCLAQELAPDVRVNSLNPGPVATKFIENAHGGPQEFSLAAGPKEFTALERFGSAEEMAKTLAFMVSDDNINMTGSIIVSDSGTMIKKAG
ncbi:3-oxoacyl-[acyl-carrier-protein] reductase FabG-like [Brevipalpus obovatus]|uniref:3-oxoacyl-[acyl-carrier-protein] reductase FabG-like n=1 Tax=Brevipalpus obovatus TaxID=246614 RepID=UPI003D9DB372